MISATEALSSLVSGITYEDLPQGTVKEAKRLILDSIACMLAGYSTEIGEIAIRFVRKMGGNPQSTIMGTGEKTSSVNAAYANGKMGNALDYDDTFLTGNHFGNPDTAAALAIGDMKGSSGKELITSVVVGFEVAARVAIGLGGVFRVERGEKVGGAKNFGSSSPMVFAAAAAAAKALGQDANRVAQTLGIAGASCPVPTNNKWGRGTTNLPLFKYTNSGWCSQTGVAAALLADEGYTGYDAILDGEYGFWFMCGGSGFDYALALERLGQRWYIDETTYKLWPACRFPIYALTAFKELLQQHDLKAEDIEKITVLATPYVAALPRFTNKQPVTLVDGQFSYPHLIAMMALGIPRTQWHAPETRNSPSVIDFRSKVEVGIDPRHQEMQQSFEAGQWRKLPTTVEVIARGEKIIATTDYARGDGKWAPGKYFAIDSELEAKFRESASFPACPLSRAPDKIELAVKLLRDLETVKDVRQLTDALSP